MKLSSRGFTLVELMIVIAIIGILAAALFPSMTGYLKRSRDTARASHMKDVSTALGAYYSDQERYPARTVAAAGQGCINHAEAAPLVAFTGVSYLPKGMPKDPSASSRDLENGCAGDNYGYNTGTVNGSTAGSSFQMTALFENENGGNTGSTISTVLQVTNYAANFGATRGAGSGYILGN